MHKSVIVFMSMLLLGGCAAKVNLNDYKTTDKDTQEATHHLPKHVLNGSKPKIAIFSPHSSVGYSCNLDGVLSEQMMGSISTLKGYDTIETSQFSLDTKPSSEAFALLRKYADYAIVISVSNASTNAEFIAPAKYENKDGSEYYSPAKCDMRGEVMVSARFVDLSTGKIKKSFQEDGYSSASSDTPYQYQCYVRNSCSLLNNAVKDAVNDIKLKFAAAAPLYGYIYKLQSGDNGRIATISLGTNQGVQKGDELDVIEFREDYNPVKDVVVKTEKTIATCTVIENELSTDHAICKLAGDKVDQVKIKHAVRIKVDQSFAHSLKKAFSW